MMTLSLTDLARVTGGAGPDQIPESNDTLARDDLKPYKLLLGTASNGDRVQCQEVDPNGKLNCALFRKDGSSTTFPLYPHTGFGDPNKGITTP